MIAVWLSGRLWFPLGVCVIFAFVIGGVYLLMTPAQRNRVEDALLGSDIPARPLTDAEFRAVMKRRFK